MTQLTVVVVVQKLHALGLQRRARLVQPCGKVVHRGFIAVVKAVHTRDDNIHRAKALGFVGHGLGVAFQTAQIGVQADDLQPRFFDQSVPVEAAALAYGMPAALVSSRTIKPMGWIINPHSSMPS